MSQLNPALLELAQRRVWSDAGGPLMEKVAVVPPGGGDPAMAGGAPPMDPAMAGGAPPMDPAMAGGAPPGAAPPMPGAAPPAAPGAAPGMGVDPATGAPQKMKPEQMMQMLDFRMYNLQMQLTAIMNAMNVELPPGALVTPPGSPVPVAEAAIPGGPQDPTQGMGAGGGGGGGSSAISPIEPMQGASPELAAMGGGGGGGGEKAGQAQSADDSFAALIEKMAEGKADTRSTGGDVDEEGPRHSSSPQKLPGPHPGVRPATQNISAGGSKDPLSRTEASDGMGAVNKAASFGAGIGQRDPSRVGTPFETLQRHEPATNAAAVAAMLRRRTTGAA